MPYIIIKDLSIKDDPNQHRFSGKAFPCNNNRRNNFTVFTVLLNNYKEVPLYRIHNIGDVYYNPPSPITIRSQDSNLTTKEEYYNNPFKILIPIIVILVIIVLVIVIVVRFKLKKKPAKENDYKGSNQDKHFSDNADNLYHNTASKNGELNFLAYLIIIYLNSEDTYVVYLFVFPLFRGAGNLSRVYVFTIPMPL